MTSSSVVADEADENEAFKDRRAVERYKLDLKCTLVVAGQKYPVLMKDISLYGLGICTRDSKLDIELTKKQMVSVEWRYGEVIDAAVVWSFNGRYGLLLKPALGPSHPLLVKAKSGKI